MTNHSRIAHISTTPTNKFNSRRQIQIQEVFFGNRKNGQFYSNMASPELYSKELTYVVMGESRFMNPISSVSLFKMPNVVVVWRDTISMMRCVCVFMSYSD